MRVPLSEFVPDVLARGPYTAPQNVAEDAVRRTAIDLCTRAGIYQYLLKFPLQAGVPDYPLEVPDGTRLQYLMWADFGPQRYYASQYSLTIQCGGTSITVPDRSTVIFRPTPYPTCEYWVGLQLWLAPTLDVCDLPDDLWQEWSDVIIDGAASRLLQQPKQVYTNQGLANRLYQQYTIGVTRAKNKRVMEHSTGPLLMRGSYFQIAAVGLLAGLMLVFGGGDVGMWL